ncbi:visual pigment-like receptor peropsin [Oncorhynchus tshawytscha]|uniref:visual pigment-like receptor peropsin n=1 Tax=Oncorhynchus tshawytscha TaxID=74940 RepID=UPI001C3D4C35|nr:visual pigment-like receptor peropsin [Oncorhynchus tshawytscha]
MEQLAPLRHPMKIANIPWRNNNLSQLYKEPPLSEQGETVIGVYLLLIGWLSLFGNILVILVLYRQRASLLPTDFLTLNLAISDASISMFGYSRGILDIFNLFRDDGFWITWFWTCQVDGFFTLLFGLASINTLTVISVTRYIKGCQLNKAYCISLSTICISLMFIWVGALFWSVAPLLGWGSYTDCGYGTCEVDWSKANYSTIYKSYIMSILISCFFVPVMVMVFSYIAIIHTVVSSNAMSADGYLSARQRKVERDITRVSIVICTAFIMAWSPYAVVSMWSACGYHVPNMTLIFTRLFAKSASFYNPLIYFGMSSKFRKEVFVLLPCYGGSAHKEVVRLKNFQEFDELKLKDHPEATTLPVIPVISLPLQSREGKYSEEEMLQTEGPVAQDSDSGVNSPSHTPPAVSQESLYYIPNVPLTPLPSMHSEMPEYESERL